MWSYHTSAAVAVLIDRSAKEETKRKNILGKYQGSTDMSIGVVCSSFHIHLKSFVYINYASHFLLTMGCSAPTSSRVR